LNAHAEVEEIWPEEGRVRVLGFVHGLDVAADGWQVVLALREPRGPELTYPAMVSGQAFEVSVPVADLVAPQAPEKGVWDVHLATGQVRLRVGRRLDDIRDKSTIMVFPAQLVPINDGFTHVRPRYTVNENLSIDYWRAA
jgi:hypothetical protein